MRSDRNETDSDKFEQLYRKHYQLLYRTALHLTHDPHLSEDATQSAYLAALPFIDKIDVENTRVTGGMLLHLCIYAIDALTEPVELMDFTVEDVRPELQTTPDDVAQAILREESYQELVKKYAWLKPKYASPLILEKVYGLSGDEIAEALGIERNYVYVCIHRAKEQIKAYLVESKEGDIVC